MLTSVTKNSASFGDYYVHILLCAPKFIKLCV